MPDPRSDRSPATSRGRSRRLAAALLAAALAVGLAASSVPVALGQGEPLLVDDAATANPELAETELQVPDGFAVDPATLRLPDGFSISVLAAGLQAPRFMTFDAAGNLLVADMDGSVYRYPAGSDGAIAPAATPPEPLLADLDIPSSVALQEVDGEEYLYVGQQSAVTRYKYDAEAALGDEETVVADLPTGGHVTRTVLFGPDGMLYLSVGSSCNICDEEDELRATVSRYQPDGSEGEVVATGLRNAVGLAFQPETETLWATVNERDDQGDEIPPDLVTTVEVGANYGWPTCMPPDATPQEDGADCAGVTPPTVGIQAHSAPLGLAFNTSDELPEEFAGDLLVAQHGSWNRTAPAAPKLLRIQMEDGQPVAASDFATGWQDAEGDRWGRPVGVVVAPDGSLVVSDDEAGVLYRIDVEAEADGS
ncbi:MAG: PQQ-dependent sugar dehydrogenase [Chloroflexia bacterium]|nr:PQQ-dependent sugar dehydrogenase [Chloroflexia bacterium]